MPRSNINIKNIILITLITFNLGTPCYGSTSIQDILKPTKNTFDWLDKLDALDALENNNSATQASETQNLLHPNRTTDSIHWLKEKTKELRSLTQMQLTDQLSIKPGKIKSKALVLSGEHHDSSGTQKAYGLKFNYEFK